MFVMSAAVKSRQRWRNTIGSAGFPMRGQHYTGSPSDASEIFQMAKVTLIFLLAFLTKRVCYVAEPRAQPDYPLSCSGRGRTDGQYATAGPATAMGFGCPD